MQPSAAAANIIKKFEGLRLKAYQCSAGVWTIGYGHTGGVSPKASCTVEQADRWLELDMATAGRDVLRLVKVPLTQGQFDALTSFVFNLGGGNLAKSGLLRSVNAMDWVAAADEFGKWVNAGGKRLPGLVRRRAAERALFLGVNE